MPPVAVAAALMALSALVQVLDSVIVRYLTAELHPFEILSSAISSACWCSRP
jgi:hypothetical protein